MIFCVLVAFRITDFPFWLFISDIRYRLSHVILHSFKLLYIMCFPSFCVLIRRVCVCVCVRLPLPLLHLWRACILFVFAYDTSILILFISPRVAQTESTVEWSTHQASTHSHFSYLYAAGRVPYANEIHLSMCVAWQWIFGIKLKY